MKIRGNTVGTTQKPESVLVKSKAMTEEQKAQARKNIGAAGQIVNTAEGTLVNITDSAYATVDDLKAYIPANTDGVNELNLTVCGKNLFDFVGTLGDENYTNTIHGVTAEIKDGMVHMYGTNEHTTYINPLISPRFNNTLYPLPAGTYTTPRDSYTYNNKTYKISLSVQLYDPDAKKNTNYSGTFTTTKTLFLVQFFSAVDYAGHTVDVTFPLMMVAGTESPTRYEPYIGETNTINLPKTSYGGYVDFTIGKYVETHNANGDLIANPVEHNVSLPQVSTLYPNTNIFTDSGDVTVSYVADTKNYIDKKFNELATAMIANG